jgi:tetratricopeptide (TPR) repeat protein
VLNAQGRFEDATEPLARAEEVYRLQPTNRDLELDVRMARVRLAMYRRRPEEARAELDAVIALQSGELARAMPQALDALDAFGMTLIVQGELAAAEEHYLDLCVRAGRSLDSDHPNLVRYRTNLARVWEAMGRYPEAESLYRENLQVEEARSGPSDIVVLSLRNNIGTCLVREGRHAEAEEILHDVWVKNTGLWGESHHATLLSQHNLANVLGLLGRTEEALALQERVLALTPAGDPEADNRRAQLETLRIQMGAAQ